MVSKKIGLVGVDAGMIWVGDPCYVIGPDASFAPDTRMDFVNATITEEKANGVPWSTPLGSVTGVCVGGFGGDGVYPVYAEIGESGLVLSVKVVFSEVDEVEK